MSGFPVTAVLKGNREQIPGRPPQKKSDEIAQWWKKRTIIESNIARAAAGNNLFE